MFSLFSAESSWYGSRQTTVHRKNVYNLTNELSICRQSYYTFERNYIFCINTYSLRRLLDQLALLLVRWEYHDQSLYICPCSYNYAQISCVNQLITAYLQLFCNAIDHSEFANRAMENFSHPLNVNHSRLPAVDILLKFFIFCCCWKVTMCHQNSFIVIIMHINQ